jgi:hypothetical protein
MKLSNFEVIVGPPSKMPTTIISFSVADERILIRVRKKPAVDANVFAELAAPYGMVVVTKDVSDHLPTEGV